MGSPGISWSWLEMQICGPHPGPITSDTLGVGEVTTPGVPEAYPRLRTLGLEELLGGMLPSLGLAKKVRAFIMTYGWGVSL